MADAAATTTVTTPAAGTGEAAAAAAKASDPAATAVATTDKGAAATTTTVDKAAADKGAAAVTSLMGDAVGADKNGHDAAGEPDAAKLAADKAAADKAAADKAAALAWKPADLKLPDGFTADEKGLAAFAELGGKHGITKDAAQALMDIYVDQIKAGNEAAANLWNTMQADNQAKMKADPDFGGAKFDDSLEAIARVIDDPAYGGKDSKAIREALGLTGAGNHPVLFRLLTRMSKALTEGKPVTGLAPKTQLDPAKTLYPELK